MMEAPSFANPCRRNATGDRVSPYLRQMTVGRSVALSVVGLAKSQKRSVSAAGAAVAAPFAKAASISIWRRREERDDDDGGLACREQIRFLQTELMPPQRKTADSVSRARLKLKSISETRRIPPLFSVFLPFESSPLAAPPAISIS